jgi:PBSX family phage terminase large subunit
MVTQTLELRGGALEMMRYRGPAVCLAGAAGTGKSVAALNKVVLKSLLVPGHRSAILRATHTSLTSTTLVSLEQRVMPRLLANGTVTWFGGSGRKPPAYTFSNGSQILVSGLDKPGKLLSSEYDLCFIDESDQVTLTAFEILRTRLRNTAPTYKQLLMCCNPSAPSHWIKEQADAGNLKLITSLHQDNPFLMRRDGTMTPEGSDYLRMLDGLTGIRRERYLHGRWVAAEGLVLDDWREDVNVIDADQVPETQRTVWTVDFGYSNPFVWQEWKIDRDGRAYLTREIHKTRTLVEDHARMILEITGGERPEAIVCDHDAEDRATLERHLGMPTLPAYKKVSLGLQLFQSRVRPAGDGKPGLYVVRGSLIGRDDVAEAEKRPRGLAAEILGYVWETVRGTDGIPKEQPVKKDDHSCDAGRYLCAYLDRHAPARLGNPAKASDGGSQSSAWSRPVGR